MKKKICVITSSRADYGLLKNIIKKLDEEDKNRQLKKEVKKYPSWTLF